MKKMFCDIVGNRSLCERLGRDILQNRLPHAIIIEGAYGSGRHTIAKMTAAALVCERANEEGADLPCLTCLSCRKVLEEKSPDVITVGREGDKATVGVDTVRFLREDVYVIPNDSDHKVYIIEEADKMTPQAQNAFLLTLEEPPSYVHFILLCENSGLLLETIRSRAPIMRTELLTTDEIDKYISSHDRRAAQLKLADPHTYAEILVAAGMGIGRALEYLDPKAFAPIKHMRALATDFVVAAIKDRHASCALPILSRFSTKRDVLSEQMAVLSEAIRDLILLKKSDVAPLSFFVDRDEALDLSDRTSIAFLYNLQAAVQVAKDEISRKANIRICMMKMMISANIL